jgi:hypothetical protein
VTTFYLDPVGGSDAGAGTSFATRWQSITSGATAARIAPGDTIRVIKSPDATSLGQNVTWTDGSRTVTLTTAVTSEVSPATAAWTAVTNTTSTTSTNRKLGATSSSLSVAAGFATGKSHYTTTTNGNYSGYQQITFWICQTSGTLASADGEISLKLCSDALGATAVNTFNIPAIKALNQWQAYTIDVATNLGASIASIGFYVNTDRGAQTFLINNVQAVKAASSSDSLSQTSLIGKNSGTEGWFCIESISGTSVVLSTAGTNYNLSLAGTPAGYAGTTASVTTYKREPLNLPSAFVGTATSSSTFGAVQDSGSVGSPITFSGGWDSTAMSSQTGDTYISGVNGFGYGLLFNGLDHVTTDKLNLVCFYLGVYAKGPSSNINVTAKDISCNSATNIYSQNNSAGAVGPVNCSFTVDNVNCAGQASGENIYLYRSAKNCAFTVVNCNSAWNYGLRTNGDGGTSNPYAISKIKANFTNVNRNGTNGYLLANLVGSNISTANLLNNASRQVQLCNFTGTTFVPGVAESTFTVTTAVTGGTSNAFYLHTCSNNVFNLIGATISGSGTVGFGTLNNASFNVILGGTFATNTTSDISVDGGTLTCIGTTLNSATKYLLSESGASAIKFQKYQNTANDHRQYYQHGTVLSDATTRHTASGISWRISPTSALYVTSDFPMVLPLAKLAVNASALVTATIWVYRDNTGITAKLVCRGGQIGGVASDVFTSASGSASTWEQLTVTFTPSEVGVVELEMQAYGGTTYSVYVDDMSISQA